MVKFSPLVAILLILAFLVACGGQPAPEKPAAEPAKTETKAAAPAPTAAPAAPKTESKPAAPAKTEPKAAAAPTAVPKAVESSKPAAKAPVAPTKITIGLMGASSDIPFYIAQEKGYYAQEGLEVKIENFSSASQMIPGLSTGQLHAGKGSGSAGLFNAITRDVPIRIVADNAASIPGRPSVTLSVRKDLVDSGVIKDYKDLKGKKIAINAKGTASEIAVDRALQKGGLTLSDVDVTLINVPDMLPAFSNKAIDAALMFEPLITVGKKQGLLVPWKGEDDFYPGHQVSVMLYAPQFVANKDAATRFMQVYLRGVREYNDGLILKKSNRAEVVAIATKYTNTKDAAMYDEMPTSYINTDGYANIESISWDQDWYVAKGYSKEKQDIKNIVDHSFIDDALKVVGKTK